MASKGIKVVATLNLNTQHVRVKPANHSTGANCNCKHVKGKYLASTPGSGQAVQYVKYCQTQTQVVKWLQILARYNYNHLQPQLPCGKVTIAPSLLGLPY